MIEMRAIKHLAITVLATTILGSGVVEAQKVRVTGANPAEGEQGTINLDVEIDGSGFDEGSVATFLVTGSDTDTGGVAVRNSTFVNGKKLIANIDIEEGAVLGDYDIQVLTAGGRRGKGNTLFHVVQQGGGNDNPYDGESIPLECTLADGPGDNLFSDGLGSYSHGQQDVACTTGGVAQPNLSGIGLDTWTRGPIRKVTRRFDLVLAPCTEDYDCAALPTALFEVAAAVDDMEISVFGIRPYVEQGDIQLLPPDTVHEMAMRLSVNGYADRFMFQMMGRVIPDDFHQGVWCDLGQNPGFDPDDAISQDVSVHVWPDNDGDGVPDGYTVTTGTFDSAASPTSLTPGARTATVCSTAGPVACGGPDNSDLCNLLGRVDVQFTIYAANQ